MDTTRPLETPRQPRALKWILVFAIAIVSNLFLNYALSLAYKSPQWNDFCPSRQVVPAVTTEADCVSQGGQWNANDGRYAPAPDKTALSGYCDVNYTCNQKYSDARSAYDRNIFVALVAAGVLLIILSFFLGANGVLKTALSLAGALSLVVASIRYWGEAHDWLKVAILGVALAALIALAVRKFKQS